MGVGLLLLGSLLLATVPLPEAKAISDLFEDFSSGWNSRWTHSTEDKYNGKFVVEVPEGLDGAALKVLDPRRLCASSGSSAAALSALFPALWQYPSKLMRDLDGCEAAAVLTGLARAT